MRKMTKYEEYFKNDCVLKLYFNLLGISNHFILGTDVEVSPCSYYLCLHLTLARESRASRERVPFSIPWFSFVALHSQVEYCGDNPAAPR